MQETHWYALYTNPRTEKKVALRLQEKGIEVYFPTVKEIRQWSDRKKMIDKPLFTSYVFVKINLTHYEAVRRVPGVVNFVYFLGKPARIRETEIEEIRKFLGRSNHQSIEFVSNDEVTVKYGPLSGKVGVVQEIGKKHLKLYIKELNINLIAEISKQQVVKNK